MRASFLILVSLFLIANGVLVMYDPSKYFSVLNRFTRWTSGSDYWAQFSPELTRPFSVRLMFRLGGAFLVLVGVNALILGVAEIAAWLQGEPSPSSGQRIKEPPVAPEGRTDFAAELVPFLFLLFTGLALILFPRQLIRRFGTQRFFIGGEAAVAPLVSTFRLVGAVCIGIAVSMLVS